MVGLLDVLRDEPQAFGLLMSGLGSAFSGDPRYLNNSVGLMGAFADLEMQREALKERARRKEQMAKLAPVYGDLAAYPGFTQPARTQEAIGLLADIAPETVMTGLLGEVFPQRTEERAEPGDIRMMKSLGLPLTAEGYARFKSLGGADGVSLLDQAQLAKLMLEIRGMTDARTAAAGDASTKKRTSERTISRNLADIEHALDLVDETEGTFLETGIPFGEARRGILSGSTAVMGMFGLDKPEMGATLDAYDQLNKTLNRLVISRDTGSLGTLTDSKLQLVQDAMGSTKISPTALRSVLLDAADSMLDEAEIRDYDVGDRAGFQERIGVRRKQKRKAPEVKLDLPAAAAAAGELANEAAAAGRAAGARAADIARMGMAELQALDVDALTEEGLAALDARLKALGK